MMFLKVAEKHEKHSRDSNRFIYSQGLRADSFWMNRQY